MGIFCLSHLYYHILTLAQKDKDGTDETASEEMI